MDTLLTPAMIKNVTFEKERGGYERAAVDSFLEEVCATVAHWSEVAELGTGEADRLNSKLEVALARVAALEEEVADLTAQLAATPTAPAAQSPEHGAVGLLALAQQTADRAVADAQAQAAELVSAAESRAESLLAAAAQTADELRASAAADATAQREAAAADSADVLARVEGLRQAEVSMREGVLALADTLRASVAGALITAAVDTADTDTGAPDEPAEAEPVRDLEEYVEQAHAEDAQEDDAEPAQPYDLEAALAALEVDADAQDGDAAPQQDSGYGDDAPQYG